MLEIATVPIPSTALAVITDMRARVVEAGQRYNAAREDAAAKKKTYDAARETFESEFDRLIARTHGEDLPLFNQSEALERAQGDPVVMKLVERMLGRDIDTNALIVAGYTEDERNQLEAYLDACDKVAEANAPIADAGLDDEVTFTPMPDPPAFLMPQGGLTDEDLEALRAELFAHGVDVTLEGIRAKYSSAQQGELVAWARACEAVKVEKGEAVTMDDFPPAPACLLKPTEAPVSSIPPTSDADAAAMAATPGRLIAVPGLDAPETEEPAAEAVEK